MPSMGSRATSSRNDTGTSNRKPGPKTKAIRKRRGALVQARWKVDNFESCKIYPLWSTGKSCVLKMNNTRKRLLTVSAFPTLRENYDYVVALASTLDAGSNPAFVQERAALQKKAVVEDAKKAAGCK